MSTYRTIILIHKKPDEAGPFGPWTKVGDIVQEFNTDGVACLASAEAEADAFLAREYADA